MNSLLRLGLQITGWRIVVKAVLLSAVIVASDILSPNPVWAEPEKPQDAEPPQATAKQSNPQVSAPREKSQHQNPSHKDGHQELLRLRSEGVAHFESGIGQKNALALFEKAVALNPESAIEQFNLAVAYKKAE